MKYKMQMSQMATWLWHFFMFWTEVFLAIRFVLHFFAVNPANGFASWVLHSTDALMTPFRGVFQPTVVGNPHYVDLQVLFVMAAYGAFSMVMLWFIAWGPRGKK
jgi:hypothetical protein